MNPEGYDQICSSPVSKTKDLPVDIDPNRAGIIRSVEFKWVNFTQIHFWFGEVPESQKQIVRDAFQTWKDCGIGLEFIEVDKRKDAEVRIGFKNGIGSWSYVGTYVLKVPMKNNTMNFGWTLRGQKGLDTALHEIGHTLGFHHEHKNPKAGIRWNRQKVIKSLSGAPNNWTLAQIKNNVLNKLEPDTVTGTTYDANSIMHYAIRAGWIEEPAKYRRGLNPSPGLSAKDISQIKKFYPSKDITVTDDTLVVGEKQFLELDITEQKDFIIIPTETKEYLIRTSGDSDVVIVLFDDNLDFIDGDDDSGEKRNCEIEATLQKGKKYNLRIRLYDMFAEGETYVKLWQ